MRIDQLAVQVAPEDVELRKSWKRESISPEGWLIPLPGDCVARTRAATSSSSATQSPGSGISQPSGEMLSRFQDFLSSTSSGAT